MSTTPILSNIITSKNDQEEFKNPINKLFNKYAEPVADWMNNNGFNSSGIITLSLVFGILALKYIGDKSFIYASISYIIFYFLDYIDDKLNEKYNTNSNFGNKYDVIKNILIHGLIARSIYTNYANFEGCSSKLFFLILILVLTLGIMHSGCQRITDSNINNNTSNSLEKISIGLCPATSKDEAIDIMKYTKYFGQSSWVIVMAVLVLLMGEFAKN
jgi:phosphatidylglycerophosphate synthase